MTTFRNAPRWERAAIISCIAIACIAIGISFAYAGNYGENTGVGSPGWGGDRPSPGYGGNAGGKISPGNAGQAAQVAAENRSLSAVIGSWFHDWFGSKPTTPASVRDTADRGGVNGGMRAEPGPGGY